MFLAVAVGQVRAHAAAFALVVVVAAASVGAGLVVAPGAGSDRVTGSLTRLGPVALTLDSAPGEAVSPVCGCFKIRHRKDWRGLTFAARKVKISQQNGGHGSTYTVTAASPDAATWEPGDLFLPSELVILRQVKGGGRTPRFSPASLPAGRAPAGWRIVRRRRLGIQPVVLIDSRQPVYVSMLGPTPIGAWIPARTGEVKVGFHRGLTPDAPLEGELTEWDRSPSPWSPLSYPLADFLGPDVVVWTRDRRAVFEDEFSPLSSKRDTPHGNVVQALVVRHPPFSVRVAAMPVVVPPRRIDDVIAAAEPGHGPFRMVLEGRAVTSPEYRRMQAILSHGDVVVHRVSGNFIDPRQSNGEPYKPESCHGDRCTVRLRTSLHRNKPMRFRYPPRPPVAQGFTVFGPLRRLRLGQGQGAFSSLDQPLLAPTRMGLRDVRMLGPEGQAVMTIPADEDGYEADVSASGSSVVADRPLTSDDYFDLGAAVVVVGILGALIGLFFAALAWFGRDRADAV